MRKIPSVLIGWGVVLMIGGGGLKVAASRGQEQAKIEWENANLPQAGEPTPSDLTRIFFPEQQKDYFVLEGASYRHLLAGPARVSGSSMPGERGNCIIAAHRDTHFRLLKDVKLGQIIAVERRGQRYEYKVVSTKVIEPSDNRSYLPTDEAALTLVTCYPFWYVGSAPKRYIVRAELFSIPN